MSIYRYWNKLTPHQTTRAKLLCLFCFLILCRVKWCQLQDIKRSCCAKREATARKRNMQTFQTKPPLAKVLSSLWPFSFLCVGTRGLINARGSRWKICTHFFRFPCCGRTYPCDVCHDENQDHPMELATRMICGFCAKEQVDYRFEISLNLTCQSVY